MFETITQTDPKFSALYNQRAFLFEHDLHQLDLFDLDRLTGLASRLGPQSAYWSTRQIAITEGWAETPPAQKLPLLDAIRAIPTTDTLVVLKDVERDEIYGPVFRDVVARFAALGGPALQQDMIHGRATLLISSPGRVTGYHVDAEANYLLQLRGAKTVWVADGSDPAVFTPDEAERFHAGDLNAARFRPDVEAKACAIPFRPGLGVHVPVEWPHWVQNGSDVSVSISINYDLRSVQRRARTWRLNAKLRRLGFDPAPPAGTWIDAGKAAIMAGYDRMKARVPA